MVQRKAVIVGGSLGGLFAGVLLREAGFDVTIAERSRQGLDGRGAGLVGQREIFAILRAVGCEHVAQIGVVARERITLDRAGRVIDRVAAPQMQLSWDRMYGAFRERFPDERYQLGRTATAAVDRGDAAFMVRPHTAMGVAKAAGDAMALRERFAGAADIASALAAFDAERRPTGVAIAAHGRRLGAALGRSRAEASP